MYKYIFIFYITIYSTILCVHAQYVMPEFEFEINKLKFNDNKISFSPVVNNDKLIFIQPSSRKVATFSNRGTKDTVDRGDFDYYYIHRDSLDFSSSVNSYGQGINSPLNEGPFCFYDSGKKVMFTRNYKEKSIKRVNGKKLRVSLIDIFTANVVSDGVWENVKPISFGNMGYSIGHPTVHPSNKFMVFMSKNPNGKGKADLYLSMRIDNNSWGRPKQIKNLNSSENDSFPMFSPLGNLYFSSVRSKGAGGMDLYLSLVKFKEDKTPEFMLPKRLPLGINTRFDELSIFWENGKSSFITSNRKNIDIHDDIYQLNVFEDFILEKVKQKNKFIVEVFDADNNLIDEIFLNDIKDLNIDKDALKRVRITEKGKNEVELDVLPSEKGDNINRLVERFLDEQKTKDVVALVEDHKVEENEEIPDMSIQEDEIKIKTKIEKTEVEHIKEEPVKEEPVKEEPVKEKPVKEEPVKEEPVKEMSPVVNSLKPAKKYKVKRGFVIGKRGQKVKLPQKYMLDQLVHGEYGVGIIAKNENIIYKNNKKSDTNSVFIQLSDEKFYEAGKKNKSDVDTLSLYNESGKLIGFVINTKSVYFDYDKSSLRPSHISYIKHIGYVLKNNNELSLNAEIKTDSRGSSEYNEMLSKRRLKHIESILNLTVPGVINRVNMKPMGEQKLENDCTDNMNCDELKHADNRVGVFSKQE